MNIFKKKDIFKVKSVPLDPEKFTEPKTAQDFMRRGFAHYARRQFERGETDFHKAIQLDPRLVDAYYGLGMVLKAQRRREDAVRAFQQVLDLLQNASPEEETRARIMRRLALGHINEINQGDWDLEKEIWHRIQ